MKTTTFSLASSFLRRIPAPLRGLASDDPAAFKAEVHPALEEWLDIPGHSVGDVFAKVVELITEDGPSMDWQGDYTT